MDVPLAAVTGDVNAGGVFCDLFGTTTPLDTATVAQLYPSPGDYVERFDKAADRTVKAGYWLKPESERFKAAAASDHVRLRRITGITRSVFC